MNKNFVEKLDVYIENENLGRNEGSEGVKNLCKIVEVLGYKDPMHFGQHEKGSYGSLIDFLEDNSGAVDAIIDFIKDSGEDIDEWSENLPEIPLEFAVDDDGVFLCQPNADDISLAIIKDGELKWLSVESIQEGYSEFMPEMMIEAMDWYDNHIAKTV